MSYIIRKTDGSIVATVTDGTVDKVSTSITLLGKNYKGIGEIYNTNLVSLLENFANTTSPDNQIKGQIWFNTSSSKLNVFDGNAWRPVGSPFVSGSRPANLVQGDLWIDTLNQQLNFYDGINLISAGPSYTFAQGKSGWIVEELVDSSGNGRVVASLYVNNVKMGILTAVAFTPQQLVPGFTTALEPELRAGLSFSTLVVNNKINASVQVATTLLDPQDGELGSDKFLRNDKSGSISGSLYLDDPMGLTIGTYQNFKLFVDGSSTILSNEINDSDTVLRVRSEADGEQDAIVIAPSLRKVSIFPNDIAVSKPVVDLNANVVVQGNLTVAGATTFTNSTTLQITDKNIELAVTGSPTNSTANGAGITVKGATDKTITWNLGTSPTPNAWDLNDNIRVPVNKAFYVDASQVLNGTTLGSTIVASSLTSVGNLTNLTAAKFNLTDNVLTVDNADLVITVPAINIVRFSNSVRLANVAEPTLSQDAATKNYVDRKKTSINYLTLDVTGLSNVETSMVGAINAMIPPSTVSAGDTVMVMCLTYTLSTVAPGALPTVTRVVRRFQLQFVVVNGISTKTWVYQESITV